MKLSWDEAKRQATLHERGLDFAQVAEIFAGLEMSTPSIAKDYGEKRILTMGHIGGRQCVAVWTQRGDTRHIISLRKANDREQKSSTSILDPADDAPELGKDFFENAEIRFRGKLIRPGRPLGSGSKVLLSLRLDKDAVAAFKATGPGWQVKINDAVVKSAKKLSSSKPSLSLPASQPNIARFLVSPQ